MAGDTADQREEGFDELVARVLVGIGGNEDELAFVLGREGMRVRRRAALAR